MEENVSVQRSRRRRHSAEFKAEAVGACMQPGISMSAVALHYRLNANLLRRWVNEQEARGVAAKAGIAMTSSSPEFLPLQLPVPKPAPATAPDIVIEVRRDAALVTVRWPSSAAAHCAHWLQGWLR